MSEKLEIVYRDPNELILDERNPRIHPDSLLTKLSASIQRFGFVDPVLITEDYMILAGHARVKTAREDGLDKVPTIMLPLTGTEAIAYNIADNKIQDSSEWNIPKLNNHLEDLMGAGFDVELTGFSSSDVYRVVNDESVAEDLDNIKIIPKDTYDGVTAKMNSSFLLGKYVVTPQAISLDEKLEQIKEPDSKIKEYHIALSSAEAKFITDQIAIYSATPELPASNIGFVEWFLESAK